MNAIEFLARDHREIEELFDELENADDGERGVRQIADELRRKIETHAAIEEELFYPAVRNTTADSRRLIALAAKDHDAIGVMLEELAAIDDDDEEMLFAAAHRLMLAVRGHVAMEEEQIFEEVRRGLDDADLDRLGVELAALTEERTSYSDEAGIASRARHNAASERTDS